MEFRQLHTFIQAAQLQSFSRAAVQLGYSQSAVTVQIRMLEKELGTRLFDRMGKQVVLTPQGQKFLMHANTILYEVNRTRLSMHEDEELKNPFVKCLKNKITASTNNANNRFSIEPKSAALFPPPNELIPTEIRLSPIDITTVPVTTAGKNRRSGFKKNPKTVSNNPPIIEAPMIAPYARTPPPIVVATLLNTPINPEDVPMMIGTRPPTGPMVKSCTSVTMPAISIAF